MPMFSKESFTQLTSCHIDLQAIFFEVIKNVDCRITEGHRSEEDQDRYFKNGKSKLEWPNSKHNKTPSLAVDVYIFPIDMDNMKRFYWFGGYVLAISQQLKDQGKITHSIRWGGDWSGKVDLQDQTFFDLVHFEIVE